MLQHAVQAFLIAAVLSPFSYYAGLAARKLGLPQITGYLLSGILCGPYCLAILSQESVSDLNIIEGACLAIIGLAAGAELQLAELDKFKKQVVCLTAGICVATWLLCYLTLTWGVSPTSHLLSSSPQASTGAVASLGATIMMARSPASAIAVLKEMDAKGTFCGIIMGVVVLKDVVVIVAFAVNMELVAMVSHPAGAGSLGPAALLLPLLSVCVSVSAGLLGGYLISLALQYQQHQHLMPLFGGAAGGAAAVARSKALLVLVLTTTLFQGVRALDAEPLLACVTAGMLVANRRIEREEDVGHLVNSIMAYSNVAFFGLAGAALKLSAIADSVAVALLVVVVRLGSIWAGSWAGGKAGGLRSDHQQLFWLGMVTQAGVAMGLARIAGTRFPVWGPHFQTLMMAIIMINMLIGPPMFRHALIKVGEARAMGLPSLHRDKSASKLAEDEDEHAPMYVTAGHLRSMGTASKLPVEEKGSNRQLAALDGSKS